MFFSAIFAAFWMFFLSSPAVLGFETRPRMLGGPDAPLRVFLDGSVGGGDYVRTEIPFVQYVRDRKDADLHIIATAQSSGAGSERRIEFIGLGAFDDLHFTLKYFSDRFATEDERREGIVRILKKGMMPFVARTEVEDRVKISFTDAPAKPAMPLIDPWDGWIFGLNLNGSVGGESSYGSNSFRGGFSVNRTTEALKISASWNGSINESRYQFEDEEIKTSTRNWNCGGLIVRSISDHWSVGGSAAASSSTYGNIKSSIRFSPALEFNFFPYAESTRKELNVLYRLTYGYYRYLEETVYDKMQEGLWSQSLSISMDIIQPWGSANASISGSHYLHDLSKNRLSLYGRISIRVWKGFSVNANGGFSMIHDQLSLVKEGLTKDELFLQLKQLSTTYNYHVSAGIGYSFGSKMSRAVNPRMDGLGY